VDDAGPGFFPLFFGAFAIDSLNVARRVAEKEEHGILCALERARYNTRSNTMTQAQKSRRELLEEFVARRPDDAFARYGLALEYVKAGDEQGAATHFQQLIEKHPDYVAGYFQYGQFLARVGRDADARKMLSDGIVVAQRAGDIHARDEMQAALNSLR